jgi:hypothetical protein
MRTSRPVAASTLLIVAVMASGCGAQTESAPRRLASDFAQAVAARNAAKACALLAPETRSELEQSAGEPCVRALGREDLPSPGRLRHFASFGTMAQATFARDVVFLTEFKSGWRVMAAGCTPQPERPYDCQLQGG